jgi:hypothetical protein
LNLCLASLTGVVLRPDPAAACSCMHQDIGFFLANGTVLPSNARGVVWAGSGRYDYEHRRMEAPPKERFEVWRVDGPRPQPIPFEVEWVSDSLAIPGEWAHTEWLFLIAPKRWAAGARYRFVDRDLQGLARRSLKLARELSVHPTVEVNVARSPIARSGGAVLLVGGVDEQEIPVMSLGGMCSQRARVTTRRLRMMLPSDLEPFRGSMLFSVRLWDASVWVPTKSLCSPGIPGRSQYLDLGEELLYYDCHRDEGAARTVTMTAWLPGTDLRLEARAQLRRDCR